MPFHFLDKILFRTKAPVALNVRREVLTNRYSFLGIITSLVFGLNAFIFGYYLLSAGFILYSVLFIAPIILNRSGFQFLASNLLTGGGIAGILILVLLWGKSSGSHFLFVALIFTALTLFPKEKKALVFVYLCLIILAFISIEFWLPESYSKIFVSESFRTSHYLLTGFFALVNSIATAYGLYSIACQVEGSLYLSQTQNIALLNGIPDKILHFNLAGRCLDFKDDHENESGATRFIGQPIRHFLSGPLALKLLSTAQKVLDTGKVISFEWESSSFGRKHFQEYRISGLNKDEVITIIRNITDKKEQESYRKAKEIAENAVKAKSEFLSSMSHEIRTPMNIILGLSKLMIREENLQGKMKENLEAISFSAENLLVIVNDILDLSKIEAGKLSIKESPFNLKSLIRKHINFMNISASDKGLQLNLEVDDAIPDMLTGDPVRINQVMMNLTGNAIKYTRKGKVDVYVELAEINSSAASVRFRIKDTGIGIPQEKLNFIFESFNQLNNAEETKGGTGLGLTISQKLVHLMGGNIDVMSVIGLGSTFSFVLPLKVSPQNISIESQKAGVPLPDLEGMSVLLAEDNTMNQFYAKQLLSSWKISVDVAGNGLEVLELTKTCKYDLILMDLQMPLMNGYEAMLKLSNEGGLNRDTPVICISADVFPETKKKAKEHGMKDFLTKPINEDDLFRIIKKHVKRKKPQICEPLKMEVMKSQRLLNPESISYIIRNDQEALSEFLALFLSSSKEDLDKLSSATITMDLEKVRGYAHKLKSSFRNIGASPSVEILLKIERLTEKEPAQQQLASLVREIIHHYQKIKEEVAEGYSKIA